MSKFENLISILENEWPEDWWLTRLKEIQKTEELQSFQMKFDAYSSALEVVSDSDFQYLVEKIKPLFKQNTEDRGKQQFFAQLNEVFAYQYLHSIGYYNVTFQPESDQIKVADLCFDVNDGIGECEVKSIFKSKNEIDRINGDAYSNIVYKELNQGFFKKLRDDIENSLSQIRSNSTLKMVYFIIEFDDLMLMYRDTYKRQILEFIENNYPNTLFYFRIGIDHNIGFAYGH